MAVAPEIFKAYDIRGLHGDQLDAAGAEQIGRAFVRVLSDLAGKAPGEFATVHQIDCRDPDTLFVAEINDWRSQKIILKPTGTKSTN